MADKRIKGGNPPGPILVMYTSTEGNTVERRVMPIRWEWLQHAKLPEKEWFIVAWDADACSECLLRAKGCDFVNGYHSEK